VNVVAALRRQVTGANEVDPWGMDPELVAAARALAPLRWQVTVGGADHVPATGPALLVANRRRLAATPLLMAAAIGHATGREVRFTGITDLAPLGPALRRVGGVLARPDEVAGLLRDGQLPAVFCQVRSSKRVGATPTPFLAAAVAVDAPVLPVAIVAPPLARRVRVEVGAPVTARRRSGPLALAELGDAVRDAIQRMVDEASPPTWIVPG
jgi:1-acyl-sn-glycerol-3-phosphate acyltransferase